MKYRDGAPLLTLALEALKELGYVCSYPPPFEHHGKNVRTLTRDGTTQCALVQTRSYDRSTYRYTVGIMIADLQSVDTVILWFESETYLLMLPAQWLRELLHECEESGEAKYSSGGRQWRVDIRLDELTLSPQGSKGTRYNIEAYARIAAAIPDSPYTAATKPGLAARNRLTQIERKAAKFLPSILADSYAYNEDVSDDPEVAKRQRRSASYERRPWLRAMAVAIHGTTCMVCGFNFGDYYGAWGENYIEVHHIVPVKDVPETRDTDPETEMAVLCSNCHRMVHRRRADTLTIGALKEHIGPHKRLELIVDPQ